MASPRSFTIASRASKLAVIQTELVLGAFQKTYPDVEFSTSYMSTAGDKNQTQALYLMGGKALWTKELEVALHLETVDMLVHSLKDVPTVLPDGMEIAGVLKREDPVDSLVVKQGLSFTSLDELPDGSVVGTSSVRRVAQLKKSYPKLKFLDVRGNLNTRLAKLDAPDGPFVAIILAKAGLVRLGLGDRVTSDLHPPVLHHAVGQGALGIEIRSSDSRARELCQTLTHWQTHWMCFAERALLRVLEGGCSVPVGAASSLEEDASGIRVLKLTGCVTSLGGDTHIEMTLEDKVKNVEEAERLGERLAKLLIENGAKEILDAITKDREEKTFAESVPASNT